MFSKLFKVECWLHPECGRSELQFTKYFVAMKAETIREIITHRYDLNSSLSKWDNYSRCEEKYTIEEVDCEVL